MSQLSMNSLSDEVVLLILEQVSEVAPYSLKDLCLVSQQFCHLATSILYRTISISSSSLLQSDILGYSDSWYTYQANIISYSRHMQIHERTHWETLASVMLKMRLLKSVHWNYKFSDLVIPKPVELVLRHTWPNAKLYIENLPVGHSDDDDYVQQNDIEMMKTLFRFSNIVSLKARMDFEHPVTVRWLTDVLLSSKKLRVLHLTLPREYGFPKLRPSILGAQDLYVEPGEKLGPLSELVYETRRFPDGRGLIPVSFFDWTQLQHLKMMSPQIIHFIQSLNDHGMKLHLKTLSLEYICEADVYVAGQQILDDFISRFRGLESLHLVNPTENLPISTLSLHGDTLTDLTIRYPRYGRDPYHFLYSVPPYSPQDINQLREGCPKLSSITLDVKINDDLPYDVFDSLCKFSNLETVRIWTRLVSPYVNMPNASPHISSDIKTVQYMFSYIRRHKIGAPLKRLHVMLGIFSTSSLMGRHYPRLGDRPNIWFTCTADGKGGVLVDAGENQHEDLDWGFYFDEERLKSLAGMTIPVNLEDILEVEREADRVFAELEDSKVEGEDDLDDLF